MRQLILGLLACICVPALANPIFYELEDLGDDRWEYSYTVENATAAPIEQFSIYFDLGLYENLAITGNATADWDGLALNPDPLLPDDGLADWLTFGQAIDVGDILGGFSVSFDWLGLGDPGEQFFEIVDPFNFLATSDGFTAALRVDPEPVPTPGSLALLLVGLGSLGAIRRRKHLARQKRGRLGIALATMLTLVLPAQASIAAIGDLSIIDRQQVSKRRAGRAFFDYTYTVTLSNAAGPLDNVVATVSSTSGNTQILEGTVDFGNVTNGATQSTDTFTLRQNRRVLFNPNDLIWSFTADEPALTNTAPTADAGSDQSVGIGSTIVLTGSGSSDPEGDDLTYQWSLAAPDGSAAELSSTGALSPTFVADVAGAYTATLIVNDGALDSTPDAVTINVLFSGDNAPSIVSSAVTSGSVGNLYNYDVNAVDPDTGDTLTYSLLTAPAGMSIDSATGAIIWTPSSSGAADVDVQVVDSTDLIDRQIFLIAVNSGAADQAPTLLPIANQSTFTGIGVMAQAMGSDPEGETLRYTLISGPSGMGINPATGELSWTPTDAQAGTANATVSVSDPGGQSAQQSFAVVVSSEPQNNAPVLDPVADLSINAQSPVSITFSATDVDADDSLSFSLTGAPAAAQFDPLTATLSWVPTSADSGTVNLVVTVRDALGASDSGAFAITVLEPVSAPVAIDDAYAVRRGDLLTVPADGVLTNDIDANNDVLSATNTSEPTRGSLDTFAGDGSFSYQTPTAEPITIGIAEQCSDNSRDLFTTPAVADLDGDGVAEIVTVANSSFSQLRLEIRSSTTCEVLAETTPGVVPEYGLITPRGRVSVGDIDGDGDLEIIVVRGSPPQLGNDLEHFLAFDHELNFLWVSEDLPIGNNGNQVRLRNTGAVIADIDGDGAGEILVGLSNRLVGGNRTLVVAYGADGQIKWEYQGGLLNIGNLVGRRGNTYPVVVADLDLDGTMEVLYHNEVLSHTGELEFTWDTLPIPGIQGARLSVAVGNFDDDPYPEVVGHDRNNLYLFDHTGAQIWSQSTVGQDHTSTFLITLADVDADGQPEIIFPGARGTINPNHYRVRAYEGDGSVKWTSDLERPDNTSTKVIGFDLDGDGADELIHNALGHVIVLSGADGSELARARISREFAGEFGSLADVAVADVDADGAAEFVWGGGRGFGAPSFIIFEGLPGNPLAPARPIYPHWGYEPAQVNVDGSIPVPQRPQWLIPGLNSQYSVAVVPGDPGSTSEDSFTYIANDGTADSNEAQVQIQITPNVNPPVIVSKPALGASPGFEYNYGVLATDADFGDTLTYTLVDAPTGMSISAIGLVSWTPVAGTTGSQRVLLVVTDGQNNSAEQTFSINVLPPVMVPDLLGQDETMAGDNLVAAGLVLGDVRQGFSNTVPIGQVISQSIANGGSSAAGAIVDVVLSLGPQPIYVPDLVGLSEGEAIAKLEANLLVAGTINRANSDELPAGAVFAQATTPLDEVPPGSAVNFTVSSGPALAVSISRSLIAAGQSIDLNTTVFDNNGVPLDPQPALAISVLPNAQSTGTAPSIGAGLITTAVDTRGGYSLIVDAGAAGQRSLAFLVRGDLEPDSYQTPVVEFANLLETLPELYGQLTTALSANDLIAVQSLGTQLAAARDAINLELLASRHPGGPENGFWPTSADARAAGFIFSSNQVEAVNMLFANAETAIEQSRRFLANLNPSAGGRNDDVRAKDNNTRLASALNTLVATDLTVGGYVNFNAESYVFLSQRIPELVHTELTAMIGLLASNGLLAGTAGADADTLARITPVQFYANAQPTFFSLSGMMSASAARSDIIKNVYVPYITNVISAAAVLAEFNALRSQSNTEDLAGIVTGASLSFHTFLQGNSIIEAPGLSRDVRSFQVQVVGPDKVQAVLDAALAFATPKNLKEFKEQADAIVAANAASVAGTQKVNVDQQFNGCFLEPSADCVQLVVGKGFPVVHSLGKFPAPVIVLLTDVASGTLHLGIYPFLPKPPMTSPMP